MKNNNFDDAVLNYNDYAEIQRIVADKLLEYATSYLQTIIMKNKLPKIYSMDIACGTGYLIEKQKKIYPNLNYHQSDYSPQMCEVAKKNNNIPTFCHDFHHIHNLNKINKQKYSIITCSMGLQWSDNMKLAISNIVTSLYDNNSMFAFAIPIENSFWEIKMMMKKYQYPSKFLNLISEQKLKIILDEILKTTNVKAHIIRCNYKVQYQNSLTFFKSIKNIGASQKIQKPLYNRQFFHNVDAFCSNKHNNTNSDIIYNVVKQQNKQKQKISHSKTKTIQISWMIAFVYLIRD